MSIEELDNIIPVNPPIVNNIIKPKNHKTNKYLILILHHV